VVADAAYATCLRLARTHYENFPVASRLVPAGMRPHIAAVYAFARVADDFADEGDRPGEVRLALLDDWGARLHAAARGQVRADGSDAEAIFTAVGETMRACRLETALFDDLLSAFRQDVVTRRYATWADLLEYCRRSANPVGRLVLRIAGHREASLDRQSDAVCTALQLTNFWQDVGRDLDKDRIYLPADLMADAGARESDLLTRTMSEPCRRALSTAASRTRALFDQGRPVADAVRGRLRWELRATWLGGRRILDRLEADGFDVFKSRPALGLRDAAFIGWQTLMWRPKKR
jgi:squalene synthase HpnC